MTAPDAPAEQLYAIPPIPELYWDGIQFYLPARDDDGTDGYEVMYLADGGHWSYQGWVAAPSEDCPVVPVVAALAGTTTPTDALDAVIGDMACGLECGGNDDGNLADYLARLRNVRALLASTTTEDPS